MTNEQFLLYLRAKSISYKTYDYIEGKTSDDFLEKHQFVIRGRRYYENPFLWQLMFSDEKYKEGITFLLNNHSDIVDRIIINALISIPNPKRQKDIFKLMEDQLKKSEDRDSDADIYLFLCIANQLYDKFDKVLELAKSLDIKPIYETFGNISNGQALLEIAKTGDKKLVQKLLDLGGDPSINDSMCFVMALKHANYEIGVMFMEKGSDIHTKNDLGLKMIERNDKILKGKLSKANDEAKQTLLKRYAEDDEKKKASEENNE